MADPAYPSLTDDDLGYISDAIKAYEAAHPPPTPYLNPRVVCYTNLGRCVQAAIDANPGDDEALKAALLACAQNYLACLGQYSGA